MRRLLPKVCNLLLCILVVALLFSISVSAQQCSDGTPTSTCTPNQPLYCNSGDQLVELCQSCGCPSGETCNPDGTCTNPCLPNVYYIDFENGDDSNDGQCSTSPWKHAPGDSAATHGHQPTAGETYAFKGGVMYESNIFVDGNDGTANNPIVYEGSLPGWGTGKAILEGSEAYPYESLGNDLYRINNVPSSLQPKYTMVWVDEQTFGLSQSPDPTNRWLIDTSDTFISPDSSTSSSITHSSIGSMTNLDQGAYVLILEGQDVATVAITSHSGSTIGVSGSYTMDKFSIINHENLQEGQFYLDEAGDDIYFKHSGSISEVRVAVNNKLFETDGASYVTLNGFEIRRTNEWAVYIENGEVASATNVTISNNDFYQIRTGATAMQALNINGLLVDNNTIVNSSRRAMRIGGDHATASNNYLRYIGGTGIYITKGDYTRIINNTMLDSAGSHSNGFSVYGSSSQGLYPIGSIIAYNKILNVHRPLTVQSIEDVSIYNNIFDGSEITSQVVKEFSGIRGYFKFYNNIVISANGSSYGTNLQIGTGTATYYVMNNIIEDWSPGSTTTWVNDYNIILSDSPTSRAGPNTITFDNVGITIEELVDLQTYQPLPNSLLIDNGTSQAEFSDDLKRDPRPQGASWDIGPYEAPSQLPSNFVERLSSAQSVLDMYTSIQDCVDEVSAGQTCLVYPGEYDEYVTVSASGTETNKITIKSSSPLQAKINATVGGPSTGGVFQLLGDHIIVDGFDISSSHTVTNYNNWGVFWIQGNDLVIENNYLHDTAAFGVRHDGGHYHNVTIRDNYLYKLQSGIHIKGVNWLVDNNELERFMWFGDDADADVDFMRIKGSKHVVRNNYAHGVIDAERNNAHVDFMQQYRSSSNNAEHSLNDVTIENNRVEGPFYHQCLILEDDEDGSDNITYRNNIFADYTSTCINVKTGNPTIYVYNNLFINGSSTGTSVTVAENNIYYDVNGVNGNNNIAWQASGGSGATNTINADPLLADPVGGNYTLLSGSPAIDNGTDLSSTGFNYDFNDVSRSQGNGWDIGPYERLQEPTEITSTANFQTFPIAQQTGFFQYEYDAVPQQAGTDGLVMLSPTAGTQYSHFATLVRFSVNNEIQALNGASLYQSDISVPYTPGMSYHFRVVVDIPNHIYDVFVTPQGQSEVQLADDYEFHTNHQSDTELNYWGLIAETGQIVVDNFQISQAEPPRCDLTNAYWSTNQVEEGTQVSLTVEGTNCEGEQIDISIFEEDGLLEGGGDDTIADPYGQGTISGGTMNGIWTAIYHNDCLGVCNPSEHYFVATLTSNTSESIQSPSDLEVTQAAAICGNGIIESGEQCDDGETADGDGCSSSCQVETDWQCTGEPSDCTFIGEPSATALVHYRFDGDTLDEGFNAHDGTIQGGVTLTTDKDGNADSAYSFDGSTGYITTPSNELQSLNYFTISFWMKADATNYAHHILWMGDSTGEANGWGDAAGTDQEMHISLGNYDGNGDSNELSFFMGNTYANADSLQITTPFSDTSNWHAIAVRVTNLSGTTTAELFIDGVMVGSDTGQNIARSNWDTTFQMGKPGASTRYFDGKLDDIRIYDSALNNVDILDLAGVSCTITETPELTCDDGQDNDCNTLIDCADSACSSDPSCSVSEPTGSFRVQAFNILHFDTTPSQDPAAVPTQYGTSATERRNRIRAVLDSTNPDIAFIQEISRSHWYSGFIDTLADPYPYQFNNDESNQWCSSYCPGILSRYPITRTDMPYAKMIEADINIGGTTVTVFSYHGSPGDPSARHAEGNHMRDRIAALRVTDPNRLFIVAGDFNSGDAAQDDGGTMYDQPVKILTEQSGLQYVSTVEDSSGNDWTYPNGKSGTQQRIDWIVASPEIIAEVTNAEIIQDTDITGSGNYASDHRVVVYDFLPSVFDDGSCSVAADCATLECKTASCPAGSCVYNDVSDGTSCTSDGNSCTVNSCQSGVCAADAAAANGNSCNDGSTCTTGDACSAGICLGSVDLSCVDTSLIVHYPFDGNTQDISGNANHATAQNGVALGLDRDANPSSAYVFDGTDDYMSSVSTDLASLDDFTLSFWLKTDNTNYARHIIWQGDTGPESNGWGNAGGTDQELHVSFGNYDGSSQDDQLSFFMGDATTNAGTLHMSTPFTDTSNWHFITVTVEDIGGQTQSVLYVDGIEQDTDTGSGISRSNWDTNLQIGKPGSNNRYYDGSLDDVRVYDRTLTSAEVLALFNDNTPPSDCSDGTSANTCSVTQPLYCSGGNLVNNCATCGCATESCLPDGSCGTQEPSNIHYIRAGATGNNDGSDWNNAYAKFTDVNWVRGDTYYVASGDFGYNVDNTQRWGRFTFNAPNPEQGTISIVKATASEHGTNTGWQSSYGVGQAIFRKGVDFMSSNYIFDGKTGGGPGQWGSGHGFLIDMGPELTHDGDNGIIIPDVDGIQVDNIVVKHTEIDMRGWEKQSYPGTLKQNGIVIKPYWDNGLQSFTARYSNISFSYNYIHDSTLSPVLCRNTENILFEYNYFDNPCIKSLVEPSTHHCEIMSSHCDDKTVRYNLFEDWGSTGGILIRGANWDIYGNAFVKRSPQYANEAGSVINAWTVDPAWNVSVYNNVFMNVDNTYSASAQGIFTARDCDGDCKVYNNLWYNLDAAPDLSGMGNVDYNAFYDVTGASASGNNQVSSGDPFVDWQNNDFNLVTSTDQGMTLSSEFETDMFGNTRGADGTWDRGAIEYSEAAPCANCLYIRKDATGAGDGSDWTNAYPSFGAVAWQRGYTYYVADGDYTNEGTIDLSAVDASENIVLKKAVDSTRCNAYGLSISECQGDASDWQESYGDENAKVRAFDIDSPHWTIDGQIGGGPNHWKEDHGFVIASTGADAIDMTAAPLDGYFTFEHIEVYADPVSEWDTMNIDNFSAVRPANYQNHLKVGYMYVHHTTSLFSKMLNGYNATYEYNYVGPVCGNSILNVDNHCEHIVNHGYDNVTFRYNIFKNAYSSGMIAVNQNEAEFWEVYGNIFYNEPTWNGNSYVMVASWGSDEVHYANFINNIFVNIRALNLYGGALGETNRAYNNILYQTDHSDGHVIWDYNYYSDVDLSPKSFVPGPHDTPENPSTDDVDDHGDPFIDWVNENFELTGPLQPIQGVNMDGLDVCNNLNDGLPPIDCSKHTYNIDMFGNVRGADGVWDRGAIEFTGTIQNGCALTNAYWSTTQVEEGTQVTFTVQGNNCEGEQVTISIFEEDGVLEGGNDDIIADPHSSGTISGGTMAGAWTAVYHADCLGTCAPSEHYFVATLANNASESIQSASDLDVTQAAPPVCGDAICHISENVTSCPQDCSSNAQLLAHLPLDSNALDASGNNNDGTLNGATFTSDPTRGSVAYFDGVDDYIAMPAGLIGGNFSVNFWYNRETIVDDNNAEALFGNSGDFAAYFDFPDWGCPGLSNELFSNWNEGGWQTGVCGGENQVVDTWYMATLVYNALSDEFSLWLDGSQVSTVTEPDEYLGGDSFYIGALEGASGSWKAFNGHMDDFRVYDGVLLQNEIQTLYGGATCLDGIQNGDETGVDCGGSCPACAPVCIDNDGDGYNTTIECGGAANIDCNDNEINAYPGAAEVCDGIDNNCVAGVDEGNGECSGGTPFCSAGSCVECIQNSDCDNGLYCDGEDICNAGVCEIINVPQIDDGIACTVDSCDEIADQVIHTTNDAVCNDGLYCNGAETCDALLDCVAGSPIVCDDGVSCSIDSCNEQTDACQTDTSACECTQNSDCDDGNSCTDDVCNPDFTCGNVNNDANSCNDGLFCTVNDQCISGACVADPRNVDDGVSCTSDSCNEVLDTVEHIAQDSVCDDALYCNGVEYCDLTLDCQTGTPPDVDDGVSCTVDACDEVLDEITHTAMDSLCDDALYCNGAEVCNVMSGCELGSPIICDDGISCTLDSCDESMDTCEFDTGLCGCQMDADCDDGNSCTDDVCNAEFQCENNANDANSCDDGLYCTVADRCEAGSCVSDAMDVDDGVSCTIDNCNEVLDSVEHIADDTVCHDGLFCNGVEVCDVSLDCQPGIAPDVDDGVSCTIDSCDEGADSITHIGVDALCDNGLYCDGVETCDIVNDCQTGTLIACDDGISCSIDSCNEQTDSCQADTSSCECQVDADCDDGNSCTDDVCNPDFTCGAVPNDANSCDDGQFCSTNDRCSAGVCIGDATDVDDGVSCTLDSCDETNDQIIHIAVDSLCDDGLYCNGEEVCDEVSDCGMGTPPDVDDGIACTVDSCDESMDQIVHSPLDGLCNDGLYCNGEEVCDEFLGCQAGSQVTCNDGISCTLDSCDELSDSCSFDTSSCGCQSDADCNDGNSCTDDVCNAQFQCESIANDANSCDDSLFCTVGDRCEAGSCVSDPRSVDDGVSCTIDNCNEITDSVEHVADDTVCHDGLFCNGVEICDELLDCQAGVSPTIDDGVSCTIDSCDEGADLVVHTPTNALCDNGLYCDGVETCDAVNDCQAGSTIVCNDGFSCTLDYCDEGLDSCEVDTGACECVSDSDCNDANSCTDDVCVNFQCVNTPDDSNTCDDGQFCTTNDRCETGVCIADNVDVDDGISCTLDSCDESSDTIDHLPVDSICDNGLFCDGLESCDEFAGCVAGIAPDIDDGISCTVDSCDEASDMVEHVPVDSLCDNGLFCDGMESCDEFVGCQAGEDVSCDDGVSCTLDSCDEDSDACFFDTSSCGCLLDSDCDDGNSCTDDVCNPDFTCSNIANDANSCDDSLFCTTNDRCEAGSCVSDAMDVDDGVSCTIDNCNEATDSIDHIADDTVCHDGFFCNGVEYCDEFSGCQAGIAPDVDDGVFCTNDYCDEDADIVIHAPEDSVCDNGLFCDGVEVCDEVNDCSAGTAPLVSDGIACTVDTCNEDSDSIEHTPNHAFCDNGLYCDGLEMCDEFIGCSADAPIFCDDGILCTLDSCNEQTDSCQADTSSCECFVDADCNDGNSCTDDRCTGNICTHIANDGNSCDDGQFCTTNDRCSSGACVADPIPVSDGVSCTLDSCDEDLDTLIHIPTDSLCDDALYCNGIESCDALLGCQAGTPPDVDDGVACTIDSCDETLDQVTHSTNDAACDNGLFCDGSESCDALLGCQAGEPVVCSDGFSCTMDSCNEATDSCDIDTSACECIVDTDCNDANSCTDDICVNFGCVAIPNDANSCDDGQFCSINDRCESGICVSESRNVDDGILCTVDSCDEDSDTVTHITNNTVCSNGLYCDGVEVCDLSLGCIAGTAPTSDDGIACTVDTCDETTDSIVHTPSNALCDNGLYCDGTETCDALFGCIAGTSIACDDGVACTTDSCNEEFDTCVADTSTCGCTSDSDCDDGNSCTDDVCNPDFTCSNVPNDANSCDDGLFCTTTDSCNAGFCVGTQVSVDDGVSCTVDSCNEELNIIENIANNTLCDDGLFCNGIETCSTTLGCVLGVAPLCNDNQSCTTDSCDEANDVCKYDEIDSDGDGESICLPLLDCDDNESTTYHAAVEICDDGIDNNCNALVDENCACTFEEARWSNIISPHNSPVELQLFAGGCAGTENLTFTIYQDNTIVQTINAVMGDNKSIEIWNASHDASSNFFTQYYFTVQHEDQTIRSSYPDLRVMNYAGRLLQGFGRYNLSTGDTVEINKTIIADGDKKMVPVRWHILNTTGTEVKFELDRNYQNFSVGIDDSIPIFHANVTVEYTESSFATVNFESIPPTPVSVGNATQPPVVHVNQNATLLLPLSVEGDGLVDPEFELPEEWTTALEYSVEEDGEVKEIARYLDNVSWIANLSASTKYLRVTIPAPVLLDDEPETQSENYYFNNITISSPYHFVNVSASIPVPGNYDTYRLRWFNGSTYVDVTSQFNIRVVNGQLIFDQFNTSDQNFLVEGFCDSCDEGQTSLGLPGGGGGSGGGGSGGGAGGYTDCANQIDDDGDGLIDYPSDPGCTSYNDDSEEDEAEEAQSEGSQGGENGEGQTNGEAEEELEPTLESPSQIPLSLKERQEKIRDQIAEEENVIKKSNHIEFMILSAIFVAVILAMVGIFYTRAHQHLAHEDSLTIEKRLMEVSPSENKNALTPGQVTPHAMQVASLSSKPEVYAQKGTIGKESQLQSNQVMKSGGNKKAHIDPHAKLREYVRHKLRKGYSIDQIRKLLLGVHWKESVVDTAIERVVREKNDEVNKKIDELLKKI